MTGVAPTKTVTAVPTLCYPTVPVYPGGLWGYALAATPTTEETLTDGGLFKLSDTDPVLVLEAHVQVGAAQTYGVTIHNDGDTLGTYDVSLLATEGGNKTRKCFSTPIIVMPYQSLKMTTTAAGAVTLLVVRAQATHIL
jgi:hypothetical protein